MFSFACSAISILHSIALCALLSSVIWGVDEHLALAENNSSSLTKTPITKPLEAVVKPRTDSRDSSLARIHNAPLPHHIVDGKPFVIPSISGDKTLYGSHKTFCTNEVFLNQEDSSPCAPTSETAVTVYEIKIPLSFSESFALLSDNLDELSLTEHQLVEFLDSHMAWLRNAGCSTFFLCKSFNQFFVVLLTFWGEFPRVAKFSLEYHYKLNPPDNYQLIVPASNE